MSVLVVGVSHNTAPVSVLEWLTLDADGLDKLVRSVGDGDHVLEGTVLATCNRIEIYTEVDRFHGSVEAVSRLLCDLAARFGGEPEDVVPHLYVHYDDGAVSHLFHVASGLDSMVVGEGQILGQVRDALRVGQEAGTIGPALNALFQQALRVGKRVHAETDVDHAAPSVVSLALERAADEVGAVAGKRALVVGAGSMAGLAAATLTRLGVGELVVASRTEARALRLAEQYDGRAVPLTEVATVLAETDLLISCTGATGVVLPLSVVAAARAEGETSEVDSVRDIVAQEIAAFLAARASATVTPTVVALRTMATGIVDAEMERLTTRLPGLAPEVRAEVEHAVRRVADKLLHQPTVRVKELANETGAVSYATALAELFSLDPDAVERVTSPTRGEGQ